MGPLTHLWRWADPLAGSLFGNCCKQELSQPRSDHWLLVALPPSLSDPQWLNPQISPCDPWEGRCGYLPWPSFSHWRIHNPRRAFLVSCYASLRERDAIKVKLLITHLMRSFSVLVIQEDASALPPVSGIFTMVFFYGKLIVGLLVMGTKVGNNICHHLDELTPTFQILSKFA